MKGVDYFILLISSLRILWGARTSKTQKCNSQVTYGITGDKKRAYERKFSDLTVHSKMGQ